MGITGGRFAVSVISLMRPAALALLLALFPGPFAQPAHSASAVLTDRTAVLDGLFDKLRRERSEPAAKKIADAIWAEWLDSGSPSIDLMMGWANDAAKDKKWDVALDFLDQVTLLMPSYAEVWNRRATVHFLRNDFAKSMTDIERTLKLEPRHFGALGGLAQIMQVTGRKALALDAWQRVLAIYPMNRNAQSEVARLSEELAGDGI